MHAGEKQVLQVNSKVFSIDQKYMVISQIKGSLIVFQLN